MTNDAELLRRYVDDRDEEAFAELVRHHLGLVYSVALRRVGYDSHVAEDVAQQVFIALARKAPSLRGHNTLGGWLYVSTHHTSAAIVRAERRRKNRETDAQTMQNILTDSTPPTDWERMRPFLDEAIVNLRADEREAVVLRFFEKRPFAEIGAALRLTEEAARKRVERALEKLHTALSKRGVTSTTTALGLALTEAISASAPLGLAHKIASSSVLAVAGPGTGSALFALLKSSVTLSGVAVVLGVAALVRQHLANENAQAELAQLLAQNLGVPVLRTENARLARTLAADEELRHSTTELASLRSTTIPSPASSAALTGAVTITLTADSTIQWGSRPVSIDEFLKLLQEFQIQHREDAIVTVRSYNGTSARSLAYIFDQVRKANIAKVSVETVTSPNVKANWF
jgi:RNA polymerase sigma factor (sigma-70 family)